MPSTTNFGWTTPADTDLVKDGAAAIRTLGNGVDTSFVDLKGGTTGQILSKNSNTDLDFTWIANDQGDITAVTAGTGLTGGGTSGAVTVSLDSPVSATNGGTAQSSYTTGDIIYSSATNTLAKRAIGTDGQVLTVSSGVPNWVTPSSGALVLISTTAFSAVTSQSFNNVFSSTYNNYVIQMSYHSSSNNRIFMRLRASGSDATGGNYYGALRSLSTGATLTTEWAGAGSTAWEIGNEPTTSATTPNRVTMTMFYPAQTSSYKSQTHNFVQGDVAKGGYGWGGFTVSGTSYDGFTIYNGTGGATTITGTVSIYGVSK